MGIIGAVTGSLGGNSQKVQFIQKSNCILQIDASLKEVHSRKSPPTQFPVENGDNVSDNVNVKPFTLELTGMITDTPIGGIQGLITEAATTLASALVPPTALVGLSAAVSLFSAIRGAQSPSAAAYAKLIQLQEQAQAFDVITTLYRYPSMWIGDLSAPRDADTGNCLIFTVSLVQLILVTPQTVNIQIFANPGLSSGLAALGQASTGLTSGFASGVANSLAGNH